MQNFDFLKLLRDLQHAIETFGPQLAPYLPAIIAVLKFIADHLRETPETAVLKLVLVAVIALLEALPHA